MEMSSRPPKCIPELQQFGHQLAVHHQTIRELAQPFDIANRGKISVEHFYRAFGASPLTKTIVKNYADTVTGFIDYFKLHSDVYTVGKTVENPDSPISEVPECFESFARYIKSRSVDLLSGFIRSDSSNTGKIPKRIFESVLSSVLCYLCSKDDAQ